MSMPVHYYGDTVRKLFILGGVLMLVFLPLFYDLIPYSIYVSLFAMLVIDLFAGLVSPQHKKVIAMNAVVAAGAFMVFEYYAVTSYGGTQYLFSLANECLAVDFFAAFYYAVKSVRGTARAETQA